MTRSILIADDEAANRQVLREAFERRGYTVREAADGYEVISVVRSAPVSLGIFDYQMPLMGGLEALRDLRQRNYHFPIIIMTSARSDELRHRALECGATAFFPKPVDLGILRDTVRSLIGEETSMVVSTTTSITIRITR